MLHAFRTATLSALAVIAVSQSAAIAKEKPKMETATVVSQDIGSEAAGAMAAPLFGTVIALPIYRHWNRVVVENDQLRLEWSETTDKFIVLPVKGTVSFFREKDYFVVLDPQKKKHKFSLVGMTTKDAKSEQFSPAPGLKP